MVDDVTELADAEMARADLGSPVDGAFSWDYAREIQSVEHGNSNLGYLRVAAFVAFHVDADEHWFFQGWIWGGFLGVNS